MSYALDTNICIYSLKDTFPKLKKVILGKQPSLIKIPSIVRAELLLGAQKSEFPKKNHDIVEQFLYPFEIIDFNKNAANFYAQIRAELEKKGTIIGPNDLIVAATCLAFNVTLITNNMGEFKRVRGLKIENWAK